MASLTRGYLLRALYEIFTNGVSMPANTPNIPRRNVAKGAAWAGPVLVVAAPAPAMAASPKPDMTTTITPATSSTVTGGSVPVTYTMTNSGRARTMPPRPPSPSRAPPAHPLMLRPTGSPPTSAAPPHPPAPPSPSETLTPTMSTAKRWAPPRVSAGGRSRTP